ncbi:hypothetical protein [Thermococcus sp. 21S7]|nr:hypothetical protein [Thermococcus sp. 21S7]
MKDNAWVLEKIRGILSEEEYRAVLRALEYIEKEFEEWGSNLVGHSFSP